jgi:hypothetical protein
MLALIGVVTMITGGVSMHVFLGRTDAEWADAFLAVGGAWTFLTGSMCIAFAFVVATEEFLDSKSSD